MRLIEEVRPTARKAYVCDVCMGRTAVGEVYVRQRVVDGRDAWVYRAHPVCHDSIRGYWAEVWGYTEVEIRHAEADGVMPDPTEFREWIDRRVHGAGSEPAS
jgi:hypothetical protein